METKQTLSPREKKQNVIRQFSSQSNHSPDVPNDEELLFQKALDEYYDLFPQIVALSKTKFIYSLEKYVKISQRYNVSQSLLKKIIARIFKEYYEPDYIKINKLIHSLTSSNCKAYKGKNFTPHCKKTKEAIHVCKSVLFELSDEFVICLKCKQIYQKSNVLLLCDFCGMEYLSSINDNDEKEDNYKPATWSKYHCATMINDTMKCNKCNKILYINTNNQKLKCFECNYEKNQNYFDWKCLICNETFKSEAKVYNPLEFKLIKMKIKQTIFDEVYAVPYEMKCDCIDDVNQYQFIHKKECNGILFEGTLNKRKIVVCGKCHLLNYYENNIWTCPICFNRFKLNIRHALACRGRSQDKYCVRKSLEDSGMKKRSSNKIFNNIPKGDNNLFVKKMSDIGISFKNHLKGKRSLNGNVSLKNMEEDDNINRNGNPDKKSKNININLNVCVNCVNINNNCNNNNNKRNSYLSLSSRKSISTQDNLSQDVFDPDNYTIINQIGQGTFGKIFKVKDKNGKYFAMKKILTSTSNELSAIEKEYEIILSMQKYNLNLVKIHGMSTKKLDPTTFAMYVLMDLAKGDWEKEIENRKMRNQYYSQEELIDIIKQLVQTFAELQKHGISHRDIKPQNILIMPNNNFKISDFGEAKEVLRKNSKDTINQTIRGTELYMSPILFWALRDANNEFTTEHNTFKSDVFSLGFCITFAATLSFNALYQIRELTDMISIKLVLKKYLGRRYTSKLLDVLYMMIEVEEKNRKDFIELEKYTVHL